MDDMRSMAAPPPSATANGTGMMHRKRMMMHMTFYWGKDAEILFSGWPGKDTGMYVLALITMFVFAVMIEWLSHSRLIKAGSNNLIAGIAQTFMHTFRIGIAYMVMLGVMSFNGGVFLAAVAGHGLGFFIFASRAFRNTEVKPPYEKNSDLPPMSC
ncbi:hypothetical protein JCGZ_02905 [Jatropha curcas]|uniref:Copper transport protein n=1 Tax=Jatropha curcas TaxID=180498 RepID=A0A067LCG3_JATCU|nr:copper transporter 6 [Jatropha curcas]KDP42175.1 hypothetical protein JCGZ_02905 [Jatropha curcas]